MARFLIDAVECQSIDDGRWLDVVQGDRFSIPNARGENLELPTIPGEIAQPFVRANLPIKVHGPIWGDGATAALARASFATRLGAVLTALGNVGDLSTLTMHPPNFALAVGTTSTITAQLVRWTAPEPQGWEQIEVDIDLLCISNPPVWVTA